MEQDFIVVREHYGDRHYKVGETRKARLDMVKHLIPLTLKPSQAQSTKMEKAPLNKSQKPSPENK